MHISRINAVWTRLVIYRHETIRHCVANSSPSVYEMPRILWKPTNCFHKNPSLDPQLKWNPVRTLTPNFFYICFNNRFILQVHRGLFPWHIQIFLTSETCCTFGILSSFCRPNCIPWRFQVDHYVTFFIHLFHPNTVLSTLFSDSFSLSYVLNLGR